MQSLILFAVGAVSVFVPAMLAGDAHAGPAGEYAVATFDIGAGDGAVEAIACADLHGDHLTDLIILWSTYYGAHHHLSTVRNPGRNGGWVAAELLKESPYAGKLLLVDVDGDGHLDLFGVNGQDGWLLLNDGHGGFANRIVMPTKCGEFVGVIDTDGDGDLDLCYLWEQHLFVCRNHGQLRFWSRELLAAEPVLAAGMARDGRGLVALQADALLHIPFKGGAKRSALPPGVPRLLGTHPATEISALARGCAISTRAHGFLLVDSGQRNFGHVPGADQCDLADCTGDGVADSVTVMGGELVVRRGAPEGGFEDPVRLLQNLRSAHLTLSDLDGDGVYEIILAAEGKGHVFSFVHS